MKKIITLSSALLLSTASYAGTAYIPSYQTDADNGYSCFKVSNVSSTSAEVNINFYNYDGTINTGTLRANHLISSLGTPFTIPEHQTALFCLNTTASMQYGYGIIKSAPLNESEGEVFVIAQGLYTGKSYSAPFGYAININNGLPF